MSYVVEHVIKVCRVRGFPVHCSTLKTISRVSIYGLRVLGLILYCTAAATASLFFFIIYEFHCDQLLLTTRL